MRTGDSCASEYLNCLFSSYNVIVYLVHRCCKIRFEQLLCHIMSGLDVHGYFGLEWNRGSSTAAKRMLCL